MKYVTASLYEILMLGLFVLAIPLFAVNRATEWLLDHVFAGPLGEWLYPEAEEPH